MEKINTWRLLNKQINVGVGSFLFTLLILLINTTTVKSKNYPEIILKPSEYEKLYSGKLFIQVNSTKNGVIQAIGIIFIPAQPIDIWKVLIDYDGISKYVPNIVNSRLIKNMGDYKITEMKGKSGFLFIKKSGYVKLKITEDYLKSVQFEKISGDFKVYNGVWIIEAIPEKNGTVLTHIANIKPDFFAPVFLVRLAQKKDFPKLLKAIKKQSIENNINPKKE